MSTVIALNTYLQSLPSHHQCIGYILFLHIYIYISIYICVCVCVCIYIYICVCVCVCVLKILRQTIVGHNCLKYLQNNYIHESENNYIHESEIITYMKVKYLQNNYIHESENQKQVLKLFSALACNHYFYSKKSTNLPEDLSIGSTAT